MMGAPSRNHLYRRRLQVVIDAGPRNHLYLLTQQVKIRSSPRNQRYLQKPVTRKRGGLSAVRGQGENTGQVTPQENLVALPAG